MQRHVITHVDPVEHVKSLLKNVHEK
jgi:hypothetical protein